jgi:hypothetical protein
MFAGRTGALARLGQIAAMMSIQVSGLSKGVDGGA